MEGEAFYNAIDGDTAPWHDVQIHPNKVPVNTEQILAQISPSKS
jgi:hypothetical protein